MLTLNSGPKFIILNALRALSMISLLFVFIANIVIMAQDIQALQQGATDTNHEDCDYIENSGVPNQPAGTFRAFFIIALNIVEVVVLFLSETGFPHNFFQNWIPCLEFKSSLVGLGVLEVLLAAQMMSHFLDPFPLVACFFLLIAGILNILTMYFDRPRFYRTIDYWRNRNGPSQTATMESGVSHSYSQSHRAPTSAAPSVYTEKEHGYGFARHVGDDNLITRSMSPPSVTHSAGGRASSPPTYSPPKRPVRMATKEGRSF
jgi:hypothetical protein